MFTGSKRTTIFIAGLVIFLLISLIVSTSLISRIYKDPYKDLNSNRDKYTSLINEYKKYNIFKISDYDQRISIDFDFGEYNILNPGYYNNKNIEYTFTASNYQNNMPVTDKFENEDYWWDSIEKRSGIKKDSIQRLTRSMYELDLRCIGYKHIEKDTIGLCYNQWYINMGDAGGLIYSAKPNQNFDVIKGDYHSSAKVSIVEDGVWYSCVGCFF